MSVADNFQHALEKLADETASTARRITNRRNISKADKTIRLAGLINRANAQAVALADAFTSRQLENLTGRAAPAKGILPVDHSARLLDATRTILADPDPLERVERLARSEPLQNAQSTVTEALRTPIETRKGYVGWVRQLNAGACPQCQRWARNGRVWPADHGMGRHISCACIQRVVISPTKPKPVRTRR
ncbi:hypothetical protein [Mycolicibacterium sp. CR10]|uniref:hypothetical protein n=1 Tax=Mycolicibacterium sp. CR10 TaxID=2562314 RepID=UPI0010C03422|nr:hypothetical protein [Mycolicibacterium sp. CR10]